MTFATVDSERNRLESLTRLLLDTFPGSVIYQQTDPLNVVKNIQGTKVDAIFIQANEINGAELRRIMQQWKPELPVCFLVEQEGYPYFATEGDVCCLTAPITGEKLRDALIWYSRKARETNSAYLSSTREEEPL